MASNYVQISVRADDGAKPDLDALKLRLDELKDRVAEARADVDTKDGDAKLIALEAQLDSVSRKVASPRIDMAGASRALAQVAAVDVAMDDLKAKADRENAESDGEGVLSRFLGGSNGKGGLSSGFLGVAGKLPLIGEQLSGIAESLGEGGGEGEEGGGMAGSLGSVAGSGAGIAVVGGIVGAVVTEVAALATGLAAAALGAVSVAALAAPAFEQVIGALGDTKAQLGKLPAPVQAAVGAVKQLESGFKAMSKAFQPTAFKILNEGLKIANQLMPYLAKFANAAAPAIEGLLGSLSKGLDSASFKSFMGFLQSLSGPVITAIGSGMGGLGRDVMTLMEQFSKKDVLNAVNIAFRLIGAALSALIWTVKISMGAWDMMSDAVRRTMTAFDVARRAIATAARDIAQKFDALRHDVAATASGMYRDVTGFASRIYHDVTGFFSRMASDVTGTVARWYHDVLTWADRLFGDVTSRVSTGTGNIVSWFKGLPGRVMGALASLPGQMLSFGAHIISMLASGIMSAVGDVTSAIGHVAGEILDHIPHSPAKKGPLSGSGDPRLGGRKIAQMLGQGLVSGTPGVSAAMARVTGAVSGGTARAGAYGAGGGASSRLQVEFSMTGNSQLLRLLQATVRQSGGDPLMFTKKVAYR